nr:lipoprotein [Streptococcus thermophilus]
MKRSLALLAALAVTFPLAACAGGSASSTDNEELQVTVADDTCDVSDDEADSGKTVFEVTNDGGRETAFLVLAEDGLRVVGTRGKISPEETLELSVELQPGSYITACRMGKRGPFVGESEFTVTGDEVDYTQSRNQRESTARDNYLAFVQNEAAVLLPKVEEFAEAYASGNDERAKELYPATRVHYKRIEPIVEQFGILNERIDATEVEYTAEADDLLEKDPTFTEWLGFHRLEKDLWPPAEGDENSDGTSALKKWEPSTPQERRLLADALIADVEQLHGTINEAPFLESEDITFDTVTSGTLTMLDRMEETAATGEENWWSRTDLSDLEARTEGARVVFDTVADLDRDSEQHQELIDDIGSRFDTLDKLIKEQKETEQDSGDQDTSGLPIDGQDTGEQDTRQPVDRAKLVEAIEALRSSLGELTA